MSAPFGNRLVVYCGAVALLGIVVLHARENAPPATWLPPAAGAVESAQRAVFAFLRIPERIEPTPATLRGLRFAVTAGARPSTKAVATRDPLAAKRDAFFPDWYASNSAGSFGPPDAAAEAGATPEARGARPARTAATVTKPGSKVPPSDQCQFGGTILLKNGKSAAIIKDLSTGQSVLLSEGESFRGVLLVQLDFFSATFAAPSGAIYRFTAVVGGSEKTFPAGDSALAVRGADAEPADSPGGGVAERVPDRE